MNKLLPRPEQYRDWKEWAAALLAALDEPESDPPTIVGSTAGNVALQNLLSGLQDKGLIVDQST